MVIKKSLYQISQQTGIPRSTLSKRADSLFGRHEGEFNSEEERKLVDFVDEYHTNHYTKYDKVPSSDMAPDSQMYGENENIHLDTLSLPSLSYSLPKELVLQLDLMIQSKIPQWRHLPDHTKILVKFLTRNLEKAMALIAEERKMAVELAKEYNEWVDEQIENDYLDGFKTRVKKDWKSLEQL